MVIHKKIRAALLTLTIAGGLTLLAGLGVLKGAEDCRPAVICVDVLFAGESSQEADARLAQAAWTASGYERPLSAMWRPRSLQRFWKRGVDELHLERKTVPIAVLFVDIRGFTKMSEELRAEPKKVVGILNEYLTLPLSPYVS